MVSAAAEQPCPCGRLDPKGRAQSFGQCCAPILVDPRRAADPESLMRSRYTAFVLGDTHHLLATWHAPQRPPQLDLEPDIKWLGLLVKRCTREDACHGTVEFVARSRVQGRGQRLHEVSRFVCEAGQWFYVDGDLSPGAEPCA